MAAVHGDYSFRLAVVNNGWTRLVPNPADASIPKSGTRVKLIHLGDGLVYLIKRAHDPTGVTPSPALPAATQAGADGDAGLRLMLYPSTTSAEIEGDGPGGAAILSDYYAWVDDAAGDNIVVVPIN